MLHLQNSSIDSGAKQEQQGLEVNNILGDLKSPMFITAVVGLGAVFLVFVSAYIWHKYCKRRRENTAENKGHVGETGEFWGKCLKYHYRNNSIERRIV